MLASIVQSIVDWWFALVLFVGIPIAVLLRVTEWWVAQRQPPPTSADAEASSMLTTRDEVEGPRYRQTRRVERRHTR